MAEKKVIEIQSIFGGQSPSHYFSAASQYNSGIGIDPDQAISSTNVKTSGAIAPTRYEKFSGSEVTGYPMFIITQNKTTNSFVYASDGKFHSFNSSLAMRATDEASTSLPIPVTGGTGAGAVYYNNFIYVAEATDISQYGGMDQGASIAMTENVWTGAKFGLTALTDVTYPTLNGVEMPNHVMHVHPNNSVYIADSVDGQGVIHRLKTTETTIEGDTNDGSEFNALDLPFGFYPTCFASWGTDLVIGAIQTLDSTIDQGKASLFFWDTFNSSFYREVPLADTLVTAMTNSGGNLYIWSGSAQGGSRLSRYLGGESLDEIVFVEDTFPPFAGAIDTLGSRVSWGVTTTYPEASVSVYSYGSKTANLPKGLHNTDRSTSAGANGVMTSLMYVQQATSEKPKAILGWGDDSNKGLDKSSATATFNSVWRSKVFNVNQKFRIDRVKIPFGAALATNMSVTPKVYIDNDVATGSAYTAINTTNVATGAQKRIYKSPDEKQSGFTNFFLELNFAGTVALPILLPIEIEIELLDE